MLISTPEELERLREEWLALWRRSPSATPFQSPMWLLPWWRAFGSDDSGTRRSVISTPRKPMGTLTQKIHCHPRPVVSPPPISGPVATATPIAAP